MDPFGSRYAPLSSGVPQGSFLDPVLFELSGPDVNFSKYITIYIYILPLKKEAQSINHLINLTQWFIQVFSPLDSWLV